MKIKVEFPYGADVTGYTRPYGFSPSLAVLCPDCAEGRAPENRKFWRWLALGGDPLDVRGYESLDQLAAKCESCGDAWYRWAVSEQAEEA